MQGPLDDGDCRSNCWSGWCVPSPKSIWKSYKAMTHTTNSIVTTTLVVTDCSQRFEPSKQLLKQLMRSPSDDDSTRPSHVDLKLNLNIQSNNDYECITWHYVYKLCSSSSSDNTCSALPLSSHRSSLSSLDVDVGDGDFCGCCRKAVAIHILWQLVMYITW